MHLFKATSRIALVGRRLFPGPGFRKLPMYILFLFTSNMVFAGDLILEGPQDTATAGYFQLSWSWPDKPEDIVYHLQEISSSADTQNDEVIYTGIMHGSVISGKPDGNYQYRVSAYQAETPVAQSNLITVTVQHHSLGKALAFFSMGVIIFLAIAIVILTGLRRTR